jgi:DNA-binding SARP family transcriptional activator
MPEPPAMAFDEDYQEYLDKNQIEQFIASLCVDGLRWWFDLDIPRLAVHLMALQTSVFESIELPPRIRLLATVTQPVIDGAQLRTLYEMLITSDDREAACVAAGAGVASVWDGGRNLSNYEPWYEIIATLLREPDAISAHAQASLHGFKGLVELTGQGKLQTAEETYTRQRLLAERAGSNSLMVFGAVAIAYCHFYRGNLDAGEIVLADASALTCKAEITHISYVYLVCCLGQYDTVMGNAAQAKSYLEILTAQPWFDLLPPAVWVNGVGHQLFANSYCAPGKELEAVAKRLRERVIPDYHAFYHCYSHYNLGVVALRLGQAHRALQYAEIATERSHASESPLSLIVPPILKIQALSDLNRDAEALALLDTWEATWGESEFNLFVSLCAMERARLLARRSALNEAHAAFKHAYDLLPPGMDMPQVGRDESFVQDLRVHLAPVIETSSAELSAEDVRPMAITTLGELSMRIGSETIHERRWRGRQTKLLLLALIIHGGSKVSTSLLADLLWPDADGDTAKRNLKVTVSRLRKVGMVNNESNSQWLTVKQSQVSLVASECRVDALEFKRQISAALAPKTELERLHHALELYRNDFMVNDTSETWIIAHREHLREIYLNGVKEFAQRCIDANRHGECLSSLQKALNLDPLNEPLYAGLMRVYLAQGYPTQALSTYRQAVSALQDAFGVAPGKILTSLVKQAESEAARK